MIPKIRYHSLREAVAHALLLVLERAYKKTGYTLSPIEIKKLSNDKQDNFQYAAYCDRKDKLLRMLLGKSYKVAIAKFTAHLRNGSTSNTRNLKRPLTTQQQQGGIPNEHPFGSSPPFTLQRVAEVLYSPFHYYSQTHKLCNALEKLLLVTSSSSAFGGSSGGEVRQRLNEEREKALLAGERGRENEVRRTKRRLSYQSPTDPNPLGLPTSPSSASASSESSMTPSIHSNHHQKLIIRGTTELQTGDGVSQANTSLSSSSMNHYPSALSQDPISTSTSTSTSTSSSTMTSASNQGNEKSKNGKSASSSLWNGTGHHLAAQNMEFNNELKDILQNGIKMKFYNLPNFTNRFIKSADDDMNQHEADTVITGNVQSQKHAPNGSKNNTHPNSSNNHQNINNKSNTSNSIDPPESIIVNPNNKPHVGSKFLSTSSYSAMIRDIATVTPLNTNGSSTSTPTTALPDPSLTVVGQQSNESMLYSTLPSTLSKIGESMTGIKERGNASSGSGTIDNHGTSSLKNHSSEGIVDKLTLATTSMATATSAAGTSLNAGIIPPTLSSLQQSESVKLEFELASINPSSSTTVGTLDLDPGPSSTSTSDSESCDDVEDYASDRSDGSSDNGYMEPFTAARVMTLNRMQQQQQRREQLLTKAMAATQSHHPNSMTSSSLYDFRPPPDSEYQSSDSIDSMMAEDSGGSDSSLSDMAD